LNEFYQFFGFGSRHQGAIITKESVAAKLDRAEEMLKWFACAAALHQIAQRRELRFIQLTFKVQI
jgi:hypothetical protein